MHPYLYLNTRTISVEDRTHDSARLGVCNIITTTLLHTNSGCGKERRILFGPWCSAKAAPVRNYLEVYSPCAGGLSAVNAIGTHLRDPINLGLTRWRMAVSLDDAAELGRNPVSKHQIQPEYGDEQADAGRDGWTRLARPNPQARTGTGEYFFPVQLTTSRIGNLTRLIHTLAICDDHTYIHTPLVLSTCSLHTNSGCGKEGRILIGPW